jgi:hypothetical protein
LIVAHPDGPERIVIAQFDRQPQTKARIAQALLTIDGERCRGGANASVDAPIAM